MNQHGTKEEPSLEINLNIFHSRLTENLSCRVLAILIFLNILPTRKYLFCQNCLKPLEEFRYYYP